MKFLFYFELATTIVVLFVFPETFSAKALVANCNAGSSLDNMNNFLIGDSTSIQTRTAKERFDKKNLGLIRKQNGKNIIKMLHEGKYFYSGRRRVVAYAGMQYDAQRKPEIKEMVTRLKDLGVNCYSYLINGSSKEDLTSLPEFCEIALKAGIEVWVVLVPPSEEPGHPGIPDTLRYPPFGLDYVKWAKDISSISKSHKNLTLFMIDDFAYNLDKFTSEYTKEIFTSLKSKNHNLLFGITYYVDQLGMKNFDLNSYLPFVEAVEWGYQDHSDLYPNYGISAMSLPFNINDFRKAFPNSLLIPCLYFTPHSSWKRKPTIAYLKNAMTIAYQDAGTFLIYCTPTRSTVDYKVVKNFCGEHHTLGK